jgi:hypothetical protein
MPDQLHPVQLELVEDGKHVGRQVLVEPAGSHRVVADAVNVGQVGYRHRPGDGARS